MCVCVRVFNMSVCVRRWRWRAESTPTYPPAPSLMYNPVVGGDILRCGFWGSCGLARGVSATVRGKQAPPPCCYYSADLVGIPAPPRGCIPHPSHPPTLIYCCTDLDEVSKGPGPAQGAEESGKGETETGDPLAEGAELPQAQEEREDPSAFLRLGGEEVLAYATRIFTKVYRDDIVRLAGMEV